MNCLSVFRRSRNCCRMHVGGNDYITLDGHWQFVLDNMQLLMRRGLGTFTSVDLHLTWTSESLQRVNELPQKIFTCTTELLVLSAYRAAAPRGAATPLDTLELRYAGDVHCLTDGSPLWWRSPLDFLCFNCTLKQKIFMLIQSSRRTSRCMWLREDWSIKWRDVPRCLWYTCMHQFWSRTKLCPWNPTSQDKTWCYNLA